MRLNYADEKLSATVSIMAESTGSIQSRLANAYLSQGHRLGKEHLPESLHEMWKEIHTAMTAVKPRGDEGSIVATTSQMTEEEASNIARKICELHGFVNLEIREQLRHKHMP